MLFDLRQCYEPSFVVDDLNCSQPQVTHHSWPSLMLSDVHTAVSHFFHTAPCCFVSCACSQLDHATWYASYILVLFVLPLFKVWLCRMMCLCIHDSLHCICCVLTLQVSPLFMLLIFRALIMPFFFSSQHSLYVICGIIKAKIINKQVNN